MPTCRYRCKTMTSILFSLTYDNFGLELKQDQGCKKKYSINNRKNNEINALTPAVQMCALLLPQPTSVTFTCKCLHYRPLYLGLCAWTSVLEPLYLGLCACTSVLEPLYLGLCAWTSVLEPLYLGLCAWTSVLEPLYLGLCAWTSVLEPLYLGLCNWISASGICTWASASASGPVCLGMRIRTEIKVTSLIPDHYVKHILFCAHSSCKCWKTLQLLCRTVNSTYGTCLFCISNIDT